MRFILTALTVLLYLSPAVAEEFPTLTDQGMEEYKLGAAPPALSKFPGLTMKLHETVEMQEGTKYKVAFLKFYLNGRYLCKATLDDGGRIDEFLVTAPGVRWEHGMAVGNDWGELQRVLPRPKLVYTYVSDTLFASSEEYPNLQFQFSKSACKKKLSGEYQVLPESSLPETSKIIGIRLFYAPK